MNITDVLGFMLIILCLFGLGLGLGLIGLISVMIEAFRQKN